MATLHFPSFGWTLPRLLGPASRSANKPEPQRTLDRLAGPSFGQLTPDLAIEISRDK